MPIGQLNRFGSAGGHAADGISKTFDFHLEPESDQHLIFNNQYSCFCVVFVHALPNLHSKARCLVVLLRNPGDALNLVSAGDW